VEFVPVGNALSFDGLNNYLIPSNAALTLPTNEITIKIWERVETVRDQFSFILCSMPAAHIRASNSISI
jgi:hypothetical protein